MKTTTAAQEMTNCIAVLCRNRLTRLAMTTPKSPIIRKELQLVRSRLVTVP